MALGLVKSIYQGHLLEGRSHLCLDPSGLGGGEGEVVGHVRAQWMGCGGGGDLSTGIGSGQGDGEAGSDGVVFELPFMEQRMFGPPDAHGAVIHRKVDLHQCLLSRSFPTISKKTLTGAREWGGAESSPLKLSSDGS